MYFLFDIMCHFRTPGIRDFVSAKKVFWASASKEGHHKVETFRFLFAVSENDFHYSQIEEILDWMLNLCTNLNQGLSAAAEAAAAEAAAAEATIKSLEEKKIKLVLAQIFADEPTSRTFDACVCAQICLHSFIILNAHPPTHPPTGVSVCHVCLCHVCVCVCLYVLCQVLWPSFSWQVSLVMTRITSREMKIHRSSSTLHL